MAVVTSVEVLHGRTVRLQFADGTERVVDLTPFLWGPVFARIATDDVLFRLVRVDRLSGTVVWPNGADLDPDVLHGDRAPAAPSR